ncbi:butyrophilin subfamily 1 member A1 isoform X2 [Alligator mississippiensis]|uniref:butyrophilin subfamily 1 member A1 isoform X2 n=1 Tax=Alligator mississippiensis TaxID=8496 RepID=UPI0028775BC5|nr:butyrophilin subfamily 1 member A1 isoform X2 [Alligator mississippiensis]
MSFAPIQLLGSALVFGLRLVGGSRPLWLCWSTVMRPPAPDSFQLTVVALLCGLTTAQRNVTAWVGDNITLPCCFPSQPNISIQHLTLTWQKRWAQGSDWVVHSFYYGKDQLDVQNPAYRGRTRLDSAGLAQGDGALMLRGILEEDRGVYQCHVTTELGRTSEIIQLTVSVDLRDAERPTSGSISAQQRPGRIFLVGIFLLLTLQTFLL